MSNFDEFFKEQGVVPVGELIGGSFQCQACFLDADEAEYFRYRKILKWTCPDGHVSYLEEFNI